MRVIIDIQTEEEAERVFERFKQRCIEELQNFELSIEGTKLKYVEKKKHTKI